MSKFSKLKKQLRDLAASEAICDEAADAIEELEKRLEVAAAVAHSGGCAGISESDALIRIRKITRTYWNRSTELTTLENKNVG